MKLPPTKPVLYTFLYLGFSALLGFNCLLSCLTYLSRDSVYGGGIYTVAGLYYGLSMNIGLLALIFFGSRISANIRCIFGLFCIVASLVGSGTICMTRTVSGNPQKASIIVMLCLMGLGTSLVQGFFISRAAQFGGMAKFSSGQALAGLLCLPLSMGFKFLFSGLSDAFSKDAYANGVFMLLSAALIAAAGPLYFKYIAPLSSAAATPTSTEGSGDLEAGERRSLLVILRDIFPMSAMIWLNFFMLFMIFPGFVGIWATRSGGTKPLRMGQDVAEKVFFFVFNLADLCGRLMVDYGVVLRPRGVMTVTGTRLAMTAVVLFVTFTKVGVFANDITRILTMLIYVALQGLAVTWAFIHAPAKISNPAEHAVAGNLTSLFLANGILLGQVLGKEASILENVAKLF